MFMFPWRIFGVSANVQFWSCWFTDFSEYKASADPLECVWLFVSHGGLIAWNGMEGTN